MIPYLFKSILCLAILLMVYHLFLEKEKMHRFNRCYLLGSMVFAAVVPLINIKMASQSIPALEYNYFPLLDQGNNQTINNRVLSHAANAALQKETNIDWAMVIIFLYAMIAFMRLLRFTRNIYLIFTSVSKYKLIEYQSAKLVLVKEKIASYSFLNYIFINEEDYSNQLVENEIITHELTHIRQKHSWDVIFVEVMQVFFWFNPILPFYKKAIQLNHEYLADDTVIKTYDNVPAYQQLLLEKIQFNSNTSLTSNFNYSVTKKRLVMMSKNYNKTRGVIKQLFIVPVLVCTVLIFSSKIIIGQEKKDPPKLVQPDQQKEKTIPHVGFLNDIPVTSTEGISKEQLAEFNSLADRTVIKNENADKKIPAYSFKGSENDRNRLLILYKQMNRQQRHDARLGFQKNNDPMKKVIPTDTQLENWKNPSDYGVWIDGKKVNNTVLNNYKASDFSHYFASSLAYTEKMKQDVMKRFNLKTMYKVQLNLMTNKGYADYYKLAKASGEYSMFHHITYDEKNKREVEWRAMVW